ncbi:hypothetical protein [Streptomyces griseoluteus]|uniref:hypothetical protein n=1 Tax=Streptomyces griseoluteus TaxID=29306 RepID=UPI003330E9A4
MTVHPYLTRMAARREPLKGHDSEEGVRRSIRYAREYRRELIVFALENGPAGRLYVEVDRELWGSIFGEEA